MDTLSPHVTTTGYSAAIISGVVGGITLAIIAARTYARLILQRNVGLDDWLMLAAVLPTFGFVVAMCLSLYIYEGDRHVWDINFTLYSTLKKLEFIMEILYFLSGALVRISVLLFYRRLSDWLISRPCKWILLITIASMVIYCLGSIAVALAQCTPVSAFWNQFSTEWVETHSFHCASNINLTTWTIVSAVVVFVQDILVATLPLVVLWNVKLPKRQRWGLRIVFAGGYLVCGFGALRGYYIYRAAYKTIDESWTQYKVGIFTAVEVLLGMISASAPALKVFFNDFFTKSNNPTSLDAEEYPLTEASSTPSVRKKISTKSFIGSVTSAFSNASD